MTQQNTSDNPVEMLVSFRDPAVRRQVRADPKQYAIDHGIIPADSEVEIRLVVAKPGTMPFPLFKAGEQGAEFKLSHDQLQHVQAAGGCNSTVGCISSVSTVSSACSSLSSAGTAGTMASAGSI